MAENLLTINHLTVGFESDEGPFKAVDDVSFAIRRGEVLGLVGESGCGKSVTALSLMRLVPSPPGRIESGEVILDGRNLLALPAADMRQVRGKRISMIFQEPSSALSPLHRIGDQLVEALRFHKEMGKKEAWRAAEEWLQKVRIADPHQRMYAYPFQLSGGMQQRIMIAMALMLGPDLVIADEPTTALDVTTQAQIFRLLSEMRRSRTSVLLITHDMGVVWEMCDRVIVMYASRIAEEGARDDIFFRPAHPYTRGLLRSIPRFSEIRQRLTAIPGSVPSPLAYPSGCHFRDRCPHAFDQCAREAPPLLEVGPGHRAACWVADQLVGKTDEDQGPCEACAADTRE